MTAFGMKHYPTSHRAENQATPLGLFCSVRPSSVRRVTLSGGQDSSSSRTKALPQSKSNTMDKTLRQQFATESSQSQYATIKRRLQGILQDCINTASVISRQQRNTESKGRRHQKQDISYGGSSIHEVNNSKKRGNEKNRGELMRTCLLTALKTLLGIYKELNAIKRQTNALDKGATHAKNVGHKESAASSKYSLSDIKSFVQSIDRKERRENGGRRRLEAAGTKPFMNSKSNVQAPSREKLVNSSQPKHMPVTAAKADAKPPDRHRNKERYKIRSTSTPITTQAEASQRTLLSRNGAQPANAPNILRKDCSEALYSADSAKKIKSLTRISDNEKLRPKKRFRRKERKRVAKKSAEFDPTAKSPRDVQICYLCEPLNPKVSDCSDQVKHLGNAANCCQYCKRCCLCNQLAFDGQIVRHTGEQIGDNDGSQIAQRLLAGVCSLCGKSDCCFKKLERTLFIKAFQCS